MSDAYDMIDRFLRNNLGSDDDYAEYSKALDSLCGAQPAQVGQGLTDDVLWELWNAQGCDDMNQSEAMKFARAIEQAALAKRVPMTGAQIAHALRAEPMVDNEESFALGIRAAERHHGIVGKEGA